MRAIALLYHDVVADDQLDSSGFSGDIVTRYKTSIEEFQGHLQAMADEREDDPVTVPALREAAGGKAPFLLTFDDGGASAPLIAGMLEEHGWHGHFLVTTDRIGSPSFVSTDQIQMLRERGHVIGSHSCSHPSRMSRLSWGEMVKEWRTSAEILSEILGEQISVASVPAGYCSRKVAEAADAVGIKALFTSEPVTACHYVGDCLVLGRYTIFRGTSAATAAAVAAGELPPRLKQWWCWNLKKAAKSLGGEFYLRMRERLLSR